MSIPLQAVVQKRQKETAVTWRVGTKPPATPVNNSARTLNLSTNKVAAAAAATIPTPAEQKATDTVVAEASSFFFSRVPVTTVTKSLILWSTLEGQSNG